MNKKAVSIVLLVALLQFSTNVGLAQELQFSTNVGLVQETRKESYVEGVITLLRYHADFIRQTASRTFKYSHNIVRHATGLRHTFGLLGPMDWHAAKAASLQKEGQAEGPEEGQTGPKLEAVDFNKMANDCENAFKVLHKAAVSRVEGGEAKPVLQALDRLQEKCDACHSLLDGIAPNVWGVAHQE